MGRYRERTDILVPAFGLALKRWGLTKRGALRILGLGMEESDFYRVLRSEDATPSEVQRVAKAIYNHGKKYKLPGWENLEHG